MKRSWPVAKLTLGMLIRRGYGLWLLGMICLVGAFIFVVCRADGVLVHELQLRSRYALTFADALLGMCLLWIACVTMRGDIEAKRLHLLTSYPLRRVEIYVGKWLGLMAYGALCQAAIMLVVGLACWITIARWPDPNEVAELRAQPRRVYAEVLPVMEDLAVAADKQLQERLADQTPPDEATLRHWRDQIRDQIRRQEQLLKPNDEKTWTFELGSMPRHGKQIILRYRFYSSSRNSKVRLHWHVRGATTTRAFDTDTADAPFSSNDLAVPIDVVPPDGKLEVTVTGKSNPELVFYRGSGLKLLYRGGTFWGNCLTFYLAVMAHYGAMITVGLAVGVAFTTSVASFVAAVLYFLALTSSFFQGFLRELATTGEGTSAELVSRVVIRIGTFFTTGLEPPQVITPLADSRAITPANLGMAMTRWLGDVLATPVKAVSSSAYHALQSSGANLALGFVFYVAIAAGLGIYLLTRKELDRVH